MGGDVEMTGNGREYIAYFEADSKKLVMNEPIVRCKDCMFYEMGDSFRFPHCAEWGKRTNVNGYCHKSRSLDLGISEIPW